MARIYGRRAPRRNRNRIYTIISLVIVVGIIAYIYIPGDSQTELIPNSSNTTVPSSTNSEGFSQPTPNTDTSELSLQATTPNWTTSSSGDVSLTNQNTSGSNQSERVNETTNTRLTVPLGNAGTTNSMLPPVQYNNSEADKLIEQANELLKKGMTQIIPARDKFNEALRSRTINAEQVKFVKKQLSSLADDWLFNKSVLTGDPLCDYYKVRSGDRLQVIGEKNKVPYEILMTINNISDARKINVGQNLKVLKGPFHAKVNRSSFTIDIYLQNTYVRTFKVGLGLPGSETPTGLWKVKPGGKLIEPVWTDSQGKTHYPSDPDYPLGSRWIALDGVSGNAVGRDGFAIHGTHEPQSLGTASSQGCIRLENGAAVLVYNMLIPAYSTVEVLD
ncbi:MAG: L,D-transpeptidase family protein [Sedimentisphaerales bacterium]|nr:L,D-transpeptidase family protein [Sedimentisphaerales bacterium]